MLKQYYFDKPMFFTYPGGCSLKVADFGVLQKYIGNYYSKTEMDRIIADMMMKHPYVSGAYELNINISRVVDANTSEYYHMLKFKNDNYEQQEKGCKVLYEDELGNIDIKNLLERYGEQYEFLYNNDFPDINQWVAIGDRLLKEHKELVSEFVVLNGDYLSSDREIAAFALAVSNMCPSLIVEDAIPYDKTYMDILRERRQAVEKIDRECDSLLEKKYLDQMVNDVACHLYLIATGKETENIHVGCKGYYLPELSYSLGEKIATILSKKLKTRVVSYNHNIDNWQKVGENYFKGRYFNERNEYGILFQMIDKLPDVDFSKEELAEMEAHQKIFG